MKETKVARWKFADRIVGPVDVAASRHDRTAL
ncbi:hypothetical protein MAXJ12_03313 [Mesorhizobium alhagi CCNWXJ12-2]|uniref:Uncharacterized protein n=1 Tax=Mesorhizobium alhagi CCNWXJ12-2 TaxID=1107882 RepID=H0HKK5_9HYPH|nr:hypothetical protein MAXJ12_03313 [Mesorhizobium alhagi CCNWXJ12-2]